MKGGLLKARLSILKPLGLEKISKIRAFTLALVTFYPWAVLSWSAQSGRMAYSLGYDDVSYAVDSATRWNFIRHNTVLDSIGNLLANPPHSPLSSFFGILGLPFFGISDFGFYFGNVVLFYLLAGLTYTIYSGIRFNFPSWIADGTLLALICSPIGFYLVHDSRPDMGTGYLTILAAIGVFGQPTNATRSYKNLVAVIFGLALVSKPPFIPHTFLLVLLALLFRWALGTDREGFSFAIRRFFDLGLRTILFCAPLLVIEFKPTIDYVIENLFAKNKSVWTFPSGMSFVDIVMEYLHPWWMYMGGFVTPLSLSLAIVAAVISRKKLNPMISLLVVLSIVSLLFIAYLRYMNAYFFSTMHVAGVVLLPLVFWEFQRILDPRFIKSLTLGAVSGLVVFALSVTVFINYPAFPETKNGERNDKVIATFLQFQRISNLYLTFSGPINQDNIGWESAKLAHNVQMSNGTFESSVQDIVSQAERYETVLVPDLLTSTFNRELPSGSLQGEVISTLLRNGFGYDATFEKLGTRYHLLRRGVSALGATVISVQGLAPIAFNRLNPAASIESRTATGEGFSMCLVSQPNRKVHIRLVDSGEGSGFSVRISKELVLYSEPRDRFNVVDQTLAFDKRTTCISVKPLNNVENLAILTSSGTSKIY
jgi:hypothetical protein